MRAEKVRAEIGREAFGDFGERDAAGVGGEDGAGFSHSVNFAPQRPLGIQVFDDRLNDPVATGELIEIVLEITGFDQRGFFVGEEAAWTLFQGVLDALQCGRVAIRLTGDIQQQRRDAGICEMRGDARAHGARA